METPEAKNQDKFKTGDRLQVGTKGKIYTVITDETASGLVWCSYTYADGVTAERVRFSSKHHDLNLYIEEGK